MSEVICQKGRRAFLSRPAAWGFWALWSAALTGAVWCGGRAYWRAARSAKPLTSERLDINAAPVGSLARLDGIGAAKAAAIVANRPYAAPQDLLSVKGIGQKTLQNILPHLRVEPPQTATTQQKSENPTHATE